MAKNYGEQSREAESEQAVESVEQQSKPEKSFNYEEEVKRAEDAYNRRADDIENETKKFAETFGLSPEELYDKYEYLDGRIQLENKHKKEEADIKPEEIFSDKDALFYKYGKTVSE